MIEIRKTEIFTKWFDGLKDRRAKARIQARIDRMEMGNFGDVAPAGEGVSELRIFYGPGTGSVQFHAAENIGFNPMKSEHNTALLLRLLTV